jgi:hypothetical protein
MNTGHTDGLSPETPPACLRAYRPQLARLSEWKTYRTEIVGRSEPQSFCAVNILLASVAFGVIRMWRRRQTRFCVRRFHRLFVLNTAPVFDELGGEH